MTSVAERHETLTATFEAFRSTPEFGSGPLAQAREAAFARFLERGFPTTRDEEWKFTNVAPIAATKFVPLAEATPVIGLDRLPTTETNSFAGLIVLMNGRPVTAAGLPALPAGVTARNVGAQDLAAPRRGATSFVDLNTALFDGGVLIEVAPQTIVAGAIAILNLTTLSTGTEATVISPRIQIVVGDRAEVTFVERYGGQDRRPYWTNAVTEVTVGPHAHVGHVKIQDEPLSAFHLASLFIRQERSSTFTSQAITFGGRIARNDIVAVLDGEGAECTLNGLYIATGESLVDTHTTIDHAKPHCPSHELYKGILAGKSRAVFNGKIIVRQDAQKTDAKQTNKALLLTDDAQINTKPQLEIFADDVKCTHGAAIGQLDDDAMFYLRARGIGVDEARHMLIEAFAGEVLDGIPVESIRERLMQTMEEKLAGR